MVLRERKMGDVRNILVIRFSSIGDIVLTTPVLRRLHETYPGAAIDYCVKAPFVPLLKGSPHIGTIYTLEKPPRGHYDMVVDLQNNLRSRAFMRTIDGDRVCRYQKQNWKKLLLVRAGLNLFGSTDSVVDRYMGALDGQRVCGDELGCELWPGDNDRSYASSVIADDRMNLAVCSGARHLTKRYPPLKFAAVIESLLNEFRLQVLLLGGGEDRRQVEEIVGALSSEAASRVTNLAGKCSLMESAAVLEACDAVLTNDTGLMHIASAFGKQLFVLFGSSVAEFGFLPYNAPYLLFEVPELACRPCSHIGRDTCPKGHFKCMKDIPEQLVAEKVAGYFKSVKQD